jgi:transcriptional regulator with XRE-family HTH domain
MKIKLFSLLILIILPLLAISAKTTNEEFPEIKQDEVPGGGKLVRKDFYDQKTLWGYIDGGADIYLEYGFDKMIIEEITQQDHHFKVENYRMINKVAVGNRICMLRKQASQSQAAVADRLGVSAQAVSKWETGLALPDIEILLSISTMFKTSINEILEGNNILRKIANRSFDLLDIAYFVPKDERDYNVDWAIQIEKGNYIQKNWEWQKENLGSDMAFSRLPI